MSFMLQARHRTSLLVSAGQVQSGDCVTLRWKVVGVEANVASVHLTSQSADGPYMIEGVPPQSSREVLFTRPGCYTFTLTATFGDGVKRLRQASITVEP